MMRQLEVGDKVLVLAGNGQLLFDDIYAFGHKLADGWTSFVEITLLKSRVLYLSGGHFILTASDPSQAWSKATMMRAQDVRVGDWVWTTTNGTDNVSLAYVQSVSVKSKEGIYNPFTISGTIVVDGILASAHSEWFLDPITPHHLVPYLPGIYQAFFLPARFLYHLMGPDKMRAFDKEYGAHGKGEDEGSFYHFISTLMAAARFWVFSPGKDGDDGEF